MQAKPDSEFARMFEDVFIAQTRAFITAWKANPDRETDMRVSKQDLNRMLAAAMYFEHKPDALGDPLLSATWFKDELIRALQRCYTHMDDDGAFIGRDVDQKQYQFWCFELPALTCYVLNLLGTYRADDVAGIRARLKRGGEVMLERIAKYGRGEGLGYRGLNLIFADVGNLHGIGEMFGVDAMVLAATAARDRGLSRQDREGFFPDAREEDDRGPSSTYHLFSLHTIIHLLMAFPEAAIAQRVVRAVDWLLKFTYPTAQPLDICNERERFHPVPGPSPLFVFSEGGRSVYRQIAAQGLKFDPVVVAEAWMFQLTMERKKPEFLRILEQSATWFTQAKEFSYCQANHKSAVSVSRPWVVAGHGYLTGPIDPMGMWHRELQQHVSLYHERIGVIFGGGNSLSQPEFSTLRTEKSYLCEQVTITGCDARSQRVEMRNDGWTVAVATRIEDDANARITVEVIAPGAAPAFVQLPIFCYQQRTQLLNGGRVLTDFTDKPVSGTLAGGATVRTRNGDIQLSFTRPCSFQWPVIPVNVRMPGRPMLPLDEAVCPLRFELPRAGAFEVAVKLTRT